MMKRVCPVCDQTMKFAHYCSNCKSWVKNPWMREVTYYLNERHPQNESGCSYHDDEAYARKSILSPETVSRALTAGAAAAEAVRSQRSRATAVPNRPRKAAQTEMNTYADINMQTGTNTYTGTNMQKRTDMYTGTNMQKRTDMYAGTNMQKRTDTYTGTNMQKRTDMYSGTNMYPKTNAYSGMGKSGSERRRRSGFGIQKVILFAVLIVLAIYLLPSALTAVRRAIYSYSYNRIEYDVDLGDYTGEDFGEAEPEAEYQELENGTVIALGKPCSGMGHFPVQGRELEEPVKELAEAYGYQIIDISQYSSNEIYGDDESFYRTWLSMELESGQEDGYQYIDLDYDTATGELHQIEIFLKDQQRAAGMTRELLNLLKDQGAIPGDGGWIEGIGDDMEIWFKQREDYYFEFGEVVIDGYFYDNGCNVFISR